MAHRNVVIGMVVWFVGGVFVEACSGTRIDVPSAQAGSGGASGGGRQFMTSPATGGLAAGGTGHAGTSPTTAGFAGRDAGPVGEGGCGQCGGCSAGIITVRCSFGIVEVEAEADADICMSAEQQFTAQGGQGGEAGGSGAGGAPADFCEMYVLPSDQAYGCTYGCREEEWWQKLGTCEILNECCVIVEYNYCGP